MSDLDPGDAVEIDDLAIQPVDAQAAAPESADGSFRVRLANFEGPFDLLLNLISRRQLDVTEVALSQVTDEFLTYIGEAGRWDLGQATGFLVVAATLLDLKAARLLPAAEVDDEEDLALLEARDLLFARLLQYRAYKLAAEYLGELERNNGRRYPRDAELEPRFAQLLPEVLIGLSRQRLAEIAVQAMAPRPQPELRIDHIHAQQVSVREQMGIMRQRLRQHGALTFRSLVGDCTTTAQIVGRFLGLLELYREGVIAFDQAAPLAELRVRWAGTDEDETGAPETDPAPVDEEYG